MGIDDLSIRKGHSYSTTIQDLRTKSVLAVMKGRSREEVLQSLKRDFPDVLALKPTAIAADRAPAYKNLVKEVYPDTTLVHDHFHIKQNVRNKGLHPVLRRVMQSHKKFPIALSRLTRNLLMNHYNGCLTDQERLALQKIIKSSADFAAKHREIDEKRSFLERVARFFPDDFLHFYNKNIWFEYNNLVSDYERLLNDKNYISKIKELIRSALGKPYREKMGKQTQAFMEKFFEEISSWSYLGKVYEYTEKIGKFYNPDHPFEDNRTARDALQKIIEEGSQSEYKEIRDIAKSLSWNESEEYIANYHRYKITNGVVEGKNCSIKAIMRKHYGIKNYRTYVRLVLIRCNRHLRERGRRKSKTA